MNKGLMTIISVSLSILMSSTSFAKSQINKDDFFEKYFAKWTEDFNNKNWPASCQIFAKSITADYRGAKQKSYDDICNGFKRVFQQPNRRYHYRFKLHNIYQAEDLAAIRITWYLTIYEKNKKISIIQDEGIDILQRDNKGRWLIVNYLAYGK